MSRVTRRGILAMSGAALAGLAGCSSSTPDECSPASFPSENSTETRSEPPSACQYGAELEQRGLDVDSTQTDPSGGAGVFYYHNPDRHRKQIRKVAVAFVPYRRIVDSGSLLTYQALESQDDRHGAGYIDREWADRRASGDMSESEYVQKVVDTYGTR